MVTEKQIQANVKNSQLSTGPLTQEGKAVVAGNAIKHGVFAKDLVIAAGDGMEDVSEYLALLVDLKRDLQPVGRLEMLLLEKIAVNYWRLKRLVRYETGEIRKGLDDFKEDALRSHYNYSRSRPSFEHLSYTDHISDDEYQDQLYKVAAMRSSGFNPAGEKTALEYVLCWRLDRDEAELSDIDYETAKKYVAGLSPQMRGKLRREILDDAEQLLGEMKEVRTWRVKFDRIKKAKSLPSVLSLNNIIKYESSLERSIFRNLAVLKTMQENRVGKEQPEDDLLEMPANN
jgi:hypothetical protein